MTTSRFDDDPAGTQQLLQQADYWFDLAEGAERMRNTFIARGRRCLERAVDTTHIAPERENARHAS